MKMIMTSIYRMVGLKIGSTKHSQGLCDDFFCPFLILVQSWKSHPTAIKCIIFLIKLLLLAGLTKLN